MFSINMIESGTIAKQRNGLPLVLFWRGGKLFCVDMDQCYPFDALYKSDGMVYPNRNDSLDIVALYRPSETPTPLSCSYKEPYWQRDETDWSKVKQDTPILVSNDGDNWQRGYFYKVKYGRIRIYNNGKASFTSCPAETTGFKYGKLVDWVS